MTTRIAQLTTTILRYGSDEPPPEQLPLRAGPLRMVFEAGDLRYVRLGEREILRRVYVAVRDRNWGTVPARLTGVQTRVETDSFHITYEAEHQEREIDFRWRATISGDRQGSISFAMDGEAQSTFLRNRIGFCVLHPPGSYAGQRCVVTHPDGTTEEGVFPDLIAPHAPFLLIQAITYEAAPGCSAEVRFSGDVFEMEDQRNWTDASYKTFCTPLRLPFPVEVPVGTRVAQAVRLTLAGDIPRAQSPQGEGAVQFTLAGSALGRLPRIGLGAAGDGHPLSTDELTRLRLLRPAHLRLDLVLSDPGYPARLRRVAGEARELGAGLEVGLHLSDAAGAELEALLAVLAEVNPDVHRWLVFDARTRLTGERLLRMAREVLGRYVPTAPVGGGTDAYFAELNRNRPPVAALDFVSYSINPQVHAFDNASLVETLEAQAQTVRSARSFSTGLPICVSPVTLRPRFNAVATGPEPPPVQGELPWQVDPRQMSLFGAAWTAGSLKYLSEQNVDSVTFYETGGWRGVMERAAGALVPERFHSLPGAVFPLYHVLADAAEFVGAEVLPTTSSNPLQVDGFALRLHGRQRLVLANMRNEQQEVVVAPVAGEVLVRMLHETNVVEAMRAPERFRACGMEQVRATGGVLRLTLGPYAVACIDMETQEGSA